MSGGSRVRVFEDSSTSGYFKHAYYNNGELTSEVTEGPYPVNVVSDVMEDVVTPNFRRRIQEGELILNPMSHNNFRVSCGGGSITWTEAPPGKHTEYIYATTGSMTRRVVHNNGHALASCFDEYLNARDVAVRTARLNALSNIDSTPYEFMEDLFELKSTFQALQGLCYAGANIAARYEASVQYLVKKGQEPGRAAANAWLGAKYGYVPIVRSIINLLDSLNNKRTPPRRRRAYGSASGSANKSLNTTVNGLTVHSIQEVQISARAGIFYQMRNPIYDTYWKYGLRLKDVPRTVWAIVPLSFVVDRFVDISSAINAFININDPNLEILGGYATVEEDWSRMYQLTNAVQAGWTASVSGDSVNESRKVKQRSLWTPTIADIVPPIHGDLDFAHMVDLIALVAQRLSNPRSS